jgi:hypothetical protein
MNIALFIIIGFLVGLYIMSVGGGSGAAVYLGILTAVVGLEGSEAISTTLAISFPALALGAYSHYRQGRINFRLGWRMLLPALPAVVIGSLASPFIPNDIYKVIIGAILAFLGMMILRQVFQSKSNKEAKKTEPHPLIPVVYAIIGGLMVGISGLSGGGPVVAGLLIMGLDMVAAAATSSFIMVGMTFAGLIFHPTGNIDWANGSGLMIGSLIGAFLAPILLSRVDTEKFTKIVKPVLGVVLLIMGFVNIFG